MDERGSRRLLTIVVVVLVLALGGMGVMFQRTQAQMAGLAATVQRLEQRGPGVRAAGVPSTAGRTFPKVLPPPLPEDRPVGPPSTAEAKAFVEKLQLSPEAWEKVARANRAWVDSIDRAGDYGPTSVKAAFGRLQKERTERLREALGSDAAMAEFGKLEAASKGRRARFQASPKDVFEGVVIE